MSVCEDITTHQQNHLFSLKVIRSFPNSVNQHKRIDLVTPFFCLKMFHVLYLCYLISSKQKWYICLVWMTSRNIIWIEQSSFSNPHLFLSVTVQGPFLSWGFCEASRGPHTAVVSLRAQKYTAESLSFEAVMMRSMKRSCFWKFRE